MTDTLQRISILGNPPADGWQEQSHDSWSFRLNKCLSENEETLSRFEVTKAGFARDVNFSEEGRLNIISSRAAEYLAELGWQEHEFERAENAISELVASRETDKAVTDPVASALADQEIRSWLLTKTDSERLDVLLNAISSGDEKTYNAFVHAPESMRSELAMQEIIDNAEEQWLSARSPQRAAELKGLRSLLGRARSSHAGLVRELESHLVDPPDEIARIAAGDAS